MTIRRRLTTWAAALALVVVAAMSAGIYLSQRAALTGILNEALQLEARQLATSWDTGGFEAEPSLPALVEAGVDDDTIAQVVSDGAIVVTTPNPAVDLPTLVPPPDRGRLSRRIEVSATEPTFLMVVVVTDVGTVGYAASPLDDIEDGLGRLLIALAIAGPAVVGSLGWIIWHVVGRALGPVEEIRSEVADINAERLHRRVSVPAVDDEIRRLAETMNQMLDRLEESASRQQRFVSDASHELRTPLTRIRSALELGRAHPETFDASDTIDAVARHSMALQRLVDDLLTSAVDGSQPLQISAVDLDDLVFAEVADHHRTPIGLDTSGVSAAQVDGSAPQLARLIRNLIDNAIEHADTTVRVTLSEDDGRAVLTVSDDGPGVPPEMSEAIFERFVRVDEARTGLGAGLGLAIVRDIAERHGGSVSVDSEFVSGARFVVVLPLRTEDS